MTDAWDCDKVYDTLRRSRETLLTAAQHGHRPSPAGLAYARRFVGLPERAFGAEAATFLLDLTVNMLNARADGDWSTE